MNRQDLQKISKLRRKEALTLLKAKCFEGAYYLIGYSVECAIKACIAKKTKQYDFPKLKQRTYIGHVSHIKMVFYPGWKKNGN